MKHMDFDFRCPFCKFDNEDVDTSSISGGVVKCGGCGRRLRAEQEGGEMECEKCGHVEECSHCVDSVFVRKLCATPEAHHWTKTLCEDIEKCLKCLDIRRIVPSSSTPSTPTP